MGVLDLGKIAAAVAAVIALLWTVAQTGHDYLARAEKIEHVDVQLQQHFLSSAEIHTQQAEILNRLAERATAKEEREKARRAQCRQLIARGALTAKDCDPGLDEEARAAHGVRR